ncbi:MAG: glycosyl hydrolase family 18 protein [Planctomycetota bacterium]
MATRIALLILGALTSMCPAAENKASPPRPMVYGWFPAEMANWDMKALDWPALTHLSVRCVVLQPDGTIQPGWGTTPERIKATVDEAHKHGVQVTILAWGTTKEGSSKYLAHHADKMAQTLLDFVKAHQLDGVNLDDETWSRDNTETKGPNRELVTNFFKVLNRKFKEARAGYHLSWASPPVISAKDKFGASWVDYQAVAEYLDAFTIMSYCLCPPSAGWTGSAQPVAGGGKAGEHARDYATCIQDYLDATGGKKEKLVLGISNNRGGTEWKCHSDQPLASIYPLLGKWRSLSALEALANAEKHGRKFDPQQQAPWYCYQEGDHFVQGWYEDDESLGAKMKLAAAKGVAGICIWVLDGAKEPPENFKLIHTHLLGKQDGTPGNK